MPDLEIELNPLDQLSVYREVKKIILKKTEHQQMTAERGEEILQYVSQEISHISTPEEAKNFYETLAQHFDELKEVKTTFQLKYKEKLDETLKVLIENIMSKGKIDLACELMDEIDQFYAGKGTIDEIIAKVPNDFKEAIAKNAKK